MADGFGTMRVNMYVMSMRGVRYVVCDSMMTVQVRTASIYAWLAVVELSSPAATRVAAMTRRYRYIREECEGMPNSLDLCQLKIRRFDCATWQARSRQGGVTAGNGLQ